MIVACEFCGQDMMVAASCVQVPVELVDGTYAPMPYGSEPVEYGDDGAGRDSRAATVASSLAAFTIRVAMPRRVLALTGR
jgi:hypothetical protein